MNAPLTSDQQNTLVRAERQAQVVQALLQVLPQHALLYTTEDTVPYECDGLTAYRQLPMLVVLPETTAQVSAILKYCKAGGIKVVPRGVALARFAQFVEGSNDG